MPLLPVLRGSRTLVRRLPRALRFIAHYAGELLRSGLRVAHDVAVPRSLARPGIVRMPLDACTDTEIALVANLISLTPGTLTVDVSEDERFLMVHVMFMDEGDEGRVIQSLKKTVEEPILNLVR